MFACFQKKSSMAKHVFKIISCKRSGEGIHMLAIAAGISVSDMVGYFFQGRKLASVNRF